MNCPGGKEATHRENVPEGEDRSEIYRTRSGVSVVVISGEMRRSAPKFTAGAQTLSPQSPAGLFPAESSSQAPELPAAACPYCRLVKGPSYHRSQCSPPA